MVEAEHREGLDLWEAMAGSGWAAARWAEAVWVAVAVEEMVVVVLVAEEMEVVETVMAGRGGCTEAEVVASAPRLVPLEVQ